MSTPFNANAEVGMKDGLVCITVKAPGAPETVIRLPKSLAMQMADQIHAAARQAPQSWVTGDRT